MKFLAFIMNKIDWKRNLEKKSNKELLQLFSETQRINLEPQIFAGQILKSRNYSTQELLEIKNKLISKLRVQFETKYGKNDAEIKRENYLKQLFYRILMGLFVWFFLYRIILTSNLFLDFSYRSVIPYLGGIFCLIPLMNVRKTHREAIEFVNDKRVKLEEDIEKLNQELDIESNKA